ncbi:MAG: HEAT repeat domain-containing protein, partial [Anaerolineales bacterium]|nr:HEAT repeat domain-containing protein [Anaerolineales bacterium]
LELQEAVPALKKLVDDGDVQVREAAIWSLGEVGGDEARAALLDLLESAADAERDFLEDALENLHFHDNLLDFPLFDGEEEGPEDSLPLDDDPDDFPSPAQRLN